MWRSAQRDREFRKIRTIRALIAALICAQCALPAVGEVRLHPLLEVLHAYEAAGYRFVYSNDLVMRGLQLEIDLEARSSIRSLETALADVGYHLDGAEDRNGETVWYIVPVRESADPVRPVSGRVTDARTGQPLSGVRVEIGTRVAYTDAQGRFELPEGHTPAIQVSRPGYQPVELSPEARLDALLEISLEAEDRLEEVVVVSSRYALERTSGSSVHTLTSQDFERIPEFGDDALRIASHLPGMASLGLSARPYVRGGLQDETLVLFNDVELLEPFHLKDFQSVFSGFNPSVIESVDVYTGGFPVRYGDRMSGVMDIDPAEAAGGFGADLMVSFLTASAAVVGTTAEGRGAWALSARRGNLDLVLDVLDPSAGTPKYSDYFGSLSYELGARTRLETGFIYYDDDVELKDLDDGDGELARSLYRNGYVWMQLHRQWSDRVYSSTVLSFGDIRNDREGFIADEDLEEGNSRLEDSRRFRVWRFGHRQEMGLTDNVSLEIGASLNYQEGSYDTLAVIERGVLAELIGIPITEVRRVDRSPRGTSGNLYGSMRFRPRHWLSLEAGLRWDYQDFAEAFEQQTSPRLSALLDIGDDTQLRLTAGRFYQAEQIHELQAADGVDRFQPAQFADHYIIGLQHRFGRSGLSVRLEGFHKRFRDPKRRFENLFNSLVLMPELASDRVPVAPEKARARGVELSLAYQPVDAVNAWLGYTHAYADDELNGRWVKRGWDQRHTVSAGLAWEPGRWSFSAAVLWHSGWQTTLLPPSLEEDELPTLARNADRLPDYVSLDLRIARRWDWQDQSLTVFFELTNAFDRDNVGAYEYDVEEDEEDGGYLLPKEPVTLLPRIPSLGVRWTFN